MTRGRRGARWTVRWAVLWATVWTALCTARADALPPGEVRTWIERTSYRFGPFGSTRTLGAELFHLDGRFSPANAGAWTFWWDATPDGQEFRAAFREIPTSVGRLTLRAGDNPLDPHREGPLREEFRQPVWIRGGSVALERRDVVLEIHGGRLTERKGFLKGGRFPAGPSNIGLSLATPTASRRLARLQWDRQDGDGDALPGRHLVQVAVGGRSPAGWSWMTEGRASRVDASSTWGSSLLVDGEFKRERFSAGGHVRRISPEFKGLGILRDVHVNEWGVRLRGSARPAESVLAGAMIDWARDIRRSAEGRPPEQRWIARTLVSVKVSDPLTLRSNLNYRDRTTVDPESLLVDQSTFSGRIEAVLRWDRTQASTSYTRGLHRDPGTDGGDWHEDAFDTRVFREIDGPYHGEVRGRWSERRLPDGAWTSREKRAEIRMTRQKSYDDRYWFTLAREHQQASVSRYERDQWLLGGGFRKPVPAEFFLDVEGRLYLAAGGREPERALLNVRLSRTFRVAGETRRDEAGELRLVENGRILGAAFEDRNANGVRDEGEEGIPGLRVTLGSGRQMLTAEDGSFLFEEVPTGIEMVHLDVTALPTVYLVPDEKTFRLTLRPRSSHTLDFPLRRSGAVSGRVAVVTEEGDAFGIAGVLVKIRGTHLDTFTDPQGRFFIPGLEAGDHVVDVIGWSLPKGTLSVTPPQQEATVYGGAVAELEDFVVTRAGKNILQIYKPEDPRGVR